MGTSRAVLCALLLAGCGSPAPPAGTPPSLLVVPASYYSARTRSYTLPARRGRRRTVIIERAVPVLVEPQSMAPDTRAKIQWFIDSLDSHAQSTREKLRGSIESVE